jgi:CRP-like cAMP-binding protein
VVFALDVAGRAYGLIPLIDGGPMTNDVAFVAGGIALEIPFAAVHTELAADPLLWATVAREVNARGRRFTEQLKSFLLDALRFRAASLLLGLVPPQRHNAPMPSSIELRLPQERFAEMLGVSRQSASVLIRGFTSDGLLKWRYGRVTLLDGARLKALADAGVGQLAHRHAPPRGTAATAGRGASEVSSAC